MWLALGLTIALCSLFGLTVWLARKEGSKEAQLQAVLAQQRKEEQEQQRAKQITDAVYSMSADDARRRLHDVANKQR